MGDASKETAFWLAATGFDADIAGWEFRLEGAIALLDGLQDLCDGTGALRTADLCAAALRDTVRQMETAREGFDAQLKSLKESEAA